MNRSSIFKKKIDFTKSQDSYLFDKNTNEKYLDFFGQYSTLTLGYNHSIFKSKEYLKQIKSIGHQKITNCEIFSDESKEFDNLFRSLTSKGIFTDYHYTCTGALAIESAIKTAMDYFNCKKKRVITFQKSFHGINSYGGIFTDRFNPVSSRLNGFPGNYWDSIENPVNYYVNGNEKLDYNLLKQALTKIENIILEKKDVCAILIEPIQCTFGDRYFPDEFFRKLRLIASKYDIPLIFDEIQVGFGVTGNIWYFESLPITPDILVFGKKTQLSGIAVSRKYNKIFRNSIRLEVTWDSDIVDMIRCKYIIKAFKSHDVLNNVKLMSHYFKEQLSKIKELKNIRNCGLLFAFDFKSRLERDIFLKHLTKNKMLCNPTLDKTIRLRPNLLVKKIEIDDAIYKIKRAIKVL